MAACYTGEGTGVRKAGNARDQRTAGKLEHSQVWEGNKGLPTAISNITPKPSESLKMTILITPSFDECVQKKIQTDGAIPKEKSYFTRLANVIKEH